MSASKFTNTPAALGFRMPAEWEPQAALWLSWPHNLETWPGQFRPIPGVFAGIVAQISRFEPVRINCAEKLQPRAKQLCAKAGADMTRVTFYNHPTNDAWCRDHGPIFVKNDKSREVAVTDWVHNAWGNKYPPYDLDNKIPPRIAEKLGMRRFENDMVLEGGSIDVNGQGLLLTSEQCLLNKNRNPHLFREEIEQNLKDYLGVKQVLWVGEGIVGDDTDGHIDDITRFFKPDGFITVVEPNKRDPNHKLLEENLERLKGFRTPVGKKFDIVKLPMPKPFGFRGQQVPASYANFLIINGAVLVPQFRQKKRDAEVCEIIGNCFPGREVIPVDCYHLIWGLGTLHCISQQQPAPPSLRLARQPESMRAFLSILTLAALLLTGCESMGDRFSEVPPKQQAFSGEPSAVSVAAVQAFKRLDFQMTHSKGVDLEAVSRIHTSVAFADSRQLTAKVHLSGVGPGKTEVELSLTEQFQSEHVGGTSQQTLRENGFFQLYFATLQQVLDENAAGVPAKKN